MPGKNVKPLGGKPLIAWSVETALQVPDIDRVIASTDDERIAEVVRRYGAEVYLRPSELAGDDSLVIDALRDLSTRLSSEGENAEIMVLLEPTCPFRAIEDVNDCLALLRKGYNSAATFKMAALNPHRAWRIVNDRPEPFLRGANPWLPRQSLPAAHQLNGAVYAFETFCLDTDSPGLLFGRIGAVVMPDERSVDIDGPMDFIVAEEVLRARACCTDHRSE